MIVTVAVAPGAIDAGLMLAVTPVGVFVARATALLPLPASVTLTVNVPVLPTCTVPPVTDGVSAKSGLVLSPPPHAFTSKAPSTDPKPVAWLYAAPLAVNPVTPGTLLLPEGVA